MADKDDPRLMTIAMAGVGAILFILIAAGIVIPMCYTEPGSAGEFGDMFGAVNAAFSGLAFLGVIVAILLQKRELSLQRKELEQTREELAGQREQLRLQNATFRQQAFETAFFSMITLHHRIVSDVTSGVDHNRRAGRDSFVWFHYRLFALLADKEKSRGRGPVADVAEEAYALFYAEYQSDLGHYFRNLYNIVKFVDRSDIGDRQFYTNLVRAQLSSDELLLLFYNCTVGGGRDKFKPLVERYVLLKHMPLGDLHSYRHHKWIEAAAFGSPPKNKPQ